MLYLTPAEVLELHRRIIEQSGGSAGLRSLNMLKSALAQPHVTFGTEDLYPTVIEKVAALTYSLVLNHPFVDGNKRTGHAAMEVFLVLNGFEVEATVDEQEEVFLQLAAGKLKREAFAEWLRIHVIAKKD